MKITPDDTCPLCGVEKETIEHFFIYYQKHINAWIFVKEILRKYANNKIMYMYINDINRIQGKDMNNIAICAIGKLHRVIWSVRCEVVKNPKISCPDIMTKYVNVLKGFILLENKRLPNMNLNILTLITKLYVQLKMVYLLSPYSYVHAWLILSLIYILIASAMLLCMWFISLHEFLFGELYFNCEIVLFTTTFLYQFP